MAGDQNASDAVSERPAQSEGDRQPLVSNSDMQEYQSSKMAQNAPDSGSIDKSQTSSLDFNAHRIDVMIIASKDPLQTTLKEDLPTIILPVLEPLMLPEKHRQRISAPNNKKL